MKNLLAVLLCFFLLTGCQSASAGKDITGEWLGRDIDECYAAWGVEPGKTALKIGGTREAVVFLTEPVDYLGDQFYVMASYPDPQDLPKDQQEFYDNKLDKLVYFLDFYKAADESAAEKAAEVFVALQDEYGASTKISVAQNTFQADGTLLNSSSRDVDPETLQKEKIVEEMKQASESGKTLSIQCGWYLPEEYEKLDADFVEAMEQHNDFQSTYWIRAALIYQEGRYMFTVTHTFGRVIE